MHMPAQVQPTPPVTAQLSACPLRDSASDDHGRRLSRSTLCLLKQERGQVPLRHQRSPPDLDRYADPLWTHDDKARPFVKLADLPDRVESDLRQGVAELPRSFTDLARIHGERLPCRSVFGLYRTPNAS